MRIAVVLLVIAAGLGALALPADIQPAVARVVVFGAGLGLVAIYLRRSAAISASTPERFELELRRPPDEPSGVASLRAVEMAVRFSVASAHDFEVRLRPTLRELARWRLLTNRGIDIDRAPLVAARTLGADLSALVATPGEPPPFDSPGVPLPELDAAIDALERI